MGNSDVALVVFCHEEELKVVALETDGRLGLAHRTISSCEEIADCVRSCSIAILVIWQRQIDEAYHSLLRKWSACPGVFSICISDSEHCINRCTCFEKYLVSMGQRTGFGP